MNITAIIVTYNRLTLLKRNIDSVRRQTHQVSNILVINNGSTDETKKWLEKQKDLAVINQDNLGGAGGFERGFKEAYHQGAEWVWAMDDDGILDENALSSIVQRKPNPDEMLCSLPINILDERTLSWPIRTLNKGTLLFTKDFSALPPKVEIDYAPFLGIFFHTSILVSIGYPIKEYFIRNDDTEFSLRFRKKFGNRIFIVPNSKIYHKKTEVIRFNLFFKKFTFGLDSSALMRRYMLRNETAMWKKHKRKFIFIVAYLPKIFFKLILIILFNKSFRLKEIPILMKDILDGANLKLGKL